MALMRKSLTCTVCPLSCDVVLEIGENNEILSLTGNKCARGKVYATKEHTAPERTLTTTVKTKGGSLPLLPVRSDQPIPKPMLKKAMEATADLVVDAPVKMGDIVIENFLDLGVNLVASRDLDRAH
jgi:CxxC motif-containing protein